jgi:hypothetical protein
MVLLEITVAKKITPLPLPPSQELRNAEILGQFIRARRTQSGVTLHDAANFCGMPVTSKEMTMKATFKAITIKTHEQTMDEFAVICDAAIKGEHVTPEEPQYSFTSFEAFRKAMTPQRFALLKVIREKQPE